MLTLSKFSKTNSFFKDPIIFAIGYQKLDCWHINLCFSWQRLCGMILNSRPRWSKYDAINIYAKLLLCFKIHLKILKNTTVRFLLENLENPNFFQIIFSYFIKIYQKLRPVNLSKTRYMKGHRIDRRTDKLKSIQNMILSWSTLNLFKCQIASA